MPQKPPFVRRRGTLFFFVVGLVALPQATSANAGTPLMWAAMIHLVIGNALLGLLEGLLLGRWFRTPLAKTVGAMIAANYISAWLGGVFIRGALLPAIPMDLNNGWRWFWIMVVAAYCLTLVLEWPFVAWWFRKGQGWLKRSVRASLVVQTSSYILLFGWYWLASGTSLYTKMRIVAPEDLTLPESVLVYFIASSDGNVYRRGLASKEEERIYELRSEHRNDRLFVRPSALDSNRWDLMARLEASDRRNPRFVEVLTNLPVQAVPDWRSTLADPPEYEGTSLAFGKVQGLASATNSPWEFSTGFWPAQGLRATQKTTGNQVRFSYETLFGAWAVRNAVHLPADKVLFQLGDEQICVFDPVDRRVALLWRGRGPAPVIEIGISNTTTGTNAGEPRNSPIPASADARAGQF